MIWIEWVGWVAGIFVGIVVAGCAVVPEVILDMAEEEKTG